MPWCDWGISLSSPVFFFRIQSRMTYFQAEKTLQQNQKNTLGLCSAEAWRLGRRGLCFIFGGGNKKRLGARWAGGEDGAEPHAHHFPASKGPLSMHVSPSTGHMKVLCNAVNKWESTIARWEKQDAVSDGQIKTMHTFGYPIAWLRQHSTCFLPVGRQWDPAPL